jgi:phosphopantothenoylcysteine decarboxylase/phosphopantothenate--cysteine ligase
MVSNGPSAIDASDNQVELLDSLGNVLESMDGTKQHVADRLLEQIEQRLIQS